MSNLSVAEFQQGETCAMSLICCSGNAVSNVRAVAEEDSELLLLPIQIIDEWTTKYPSFKSFILKTYQHRFEELLNTIDSIAFHNLDDRLSQLLKQMERKGKIQMGRNKITLL